MKVLTLNTHSWQEENQLEKLETLTHAILEQDFDVIALQEVNQHQSSALIHEPIPSNTGIKQGNYAYLLQKKLARLGAKYHLCWDYVHQSYDVYEEGLAFLTKAEILSHQTIDLSPDYDETFWKHRRASHI
ncbi:MAG: exodeoxyribonuclease III, partial [Vibrio sp.]